VDIDEKKLICDPPLGRSSHGTPLSLYANRQKIPDIWDADFSGTDVDVLCFGLCPHIGKS
jgi:hypothetical protein